MNVEFLNMCALLLRPHQVFLTPLFQLFLVFKGRESLCHTHTVLSNDHAMQCNETELRKTSHKTHKLFVPKKMLIESHWTGLHIHDVYFTSKKMKEKAYQRIAD